MKEFPYILLTLSQRQQLCSKLQQVTNDVQIKDFNLNYLPKLIPPNNYYFISKNPLNYTEEKHAYMQYEQLTTYYNQKDRVNSTLQNNLHNILYLYQHNKINGDNYVLMNNTAIARTFYTSNWIKLFKLLNIKNLRILDVCTGWGELLIAACAMDAYYVGTDELRNYDDILKDLSTNNLQQVINSSFKDALLPDSKFNFILLHTPYLKVKNLNDINLDKYKNMDYLTWYNDFLIPLIPKVISYLDVYGILCIKLINLHPRNDFLTLLINHLNQRLDLIYEGVISYGDIDTEALFLWRKIPHIVINPTPYIQKFTDFDVMREDVLYGGAKQRIISQIKLDKTTIYAGPDQGFAQVALGIANKINKQETIMLTSLTNDSITNTTVRALQFGTKIALVDNIPLYELQEQAKIYANQQQAFLLSFGMQNYVQEYVNAFKDYINDIQQYDNIWLTVGSATILNALRILFPNTHLHGLQVGKTVSKELIPINTTIYVSNLNFNKTTKNLPPYPSIDTYDAKIWEIFLKHKDNYCGTHLIWNIAADQIIDFSPPNIKKEYSRWQHINKVFKISSYSTLNSKKQYEAKNILERFILGMVNLPKRGNYIVDEDIILDKRALHNDLLNKFNEELQEKQIDTWNPLSLLFKWDGKILNNNYHVQYNIEKIHNVQVAVLSYGEFTTDLSMNRMNWLLQHADLEQIMIMLLRYASILAGAQHWHMPPWVIKEYIPWGITIEGFASPRNVQLSLFSKIGKQLHFCSLFYDTDCKFGSLGSFFEQDFQNKIVSVGPPYTEDLFIHIANFCNKQCDISFANNNKIKFLITMVLWKDSLGQDILRNSKYLTFYDVLTKPHYYINSNQYDTAIKVKFSTVMFVLSVGYKDENKDSLIEFFQLQEQLR
jgi:hypothetical protein